jgi:hypothetical protein
VIELYTELTEFRIKRSGMYGDIKLVNDIVKFERDSEGRPVSATMEPTFMRIRRQVMSDDELLTAAESWAPRAPSSGESPQREAGGDQEAAAAETDSTQVQSTLDELD